MTIIVGTLSWEQAPGVDLPKWVDLPKIGPSNPNVRFLVIFGAQYKIN